MTAAGCRPAGRHRQRGLSLVELMVGIAVGLFIVAAATTMVGTQLSENRRLLLDTQVQQDLRATLDIIIRELRRSAFQADAGTLTGVWLLDGDASQLQANPDSLVIIQASSDKVEFLRQVPVGTTPYTGTDQVLGYQRVSALNASGQNVGTVRTEIGVNNWQDLTDTNVLNVVAFNVAQQASAPIKLMCPKLCPVTNDDSCWPTMQVRELTVSITGQPVSDSSPSSQRTVVGRVRLRNDLVNYNAAAVCPP